MSKPGRLPKLTPELAKRFCEAIANGMSRTRAGDLVGIHRVTVARWMKLGRSGKGGKLATDCANFVTQVVQSEARFIEKNLQSVRRAAAPRRVRTTKTYTRGDGSSSSEVTEKVEYDWAAARWLLECRDRESFGPDRHEIAELKKDINELRKLLSEAIGKAAKSADDQAGGAVQPADRAGAVGGGSGDPAAVPPAGELPSQRVDSGAADGPPTSGGAG